MKSGGGKDRRKKNMASKAQLLSKEKKRREPSSDNEDEESEELRVSAGEENYNLSGEKAEDDDPKMAKSRGDSHEIRLDSDSDGGSPSDYELRPISKTPKSSSQRVHDEKGWTRSPAMEVRNQKTGEGAKTPGGCISRVWSDEGEVTLLREMVAFRDAKGRDPSTNIEAFYDFVKGKLEVEFSKDQVKGKIRRMRKKFFNALESSKNGEGLVFSNPHDDNLFELSKKIWEIPVGNTSESIRKGEHLDKNVNDEEEEKNMSLETSSQEEESDELQSDSVPARKEKTNLSSEKVENDDPKMAKPRDHDHDKKGRSRTQAREVKKQRVGEGTKSPGGCITRLWSNEDEVMVLNGMNAFREAKSRDPTTDMVAFSDFIRGKVQIEFSKDQLKGKIKRLEKRFFNALKHSNNGEDPIFSNPHEIKLFDLSKKIWGVNTSKSIKKGEKLEKNVYKEEKEAEAMGTKKKKKKVQEVKGGAEQEIKDIETGKVNGVEKANVSGANAKNFETGYLLLEEGGLGHEEQKAWKKLMIEEMEAFVRLLEVKTQQQEFLLQTIRP